MFGVRSWLTPCTAPARSLQASSSPDSRRFAWAWPHPPLGWVIWLRASSGVATARAVVLRRCRRRDVEAEKHQYGPRPHQREGDGSANLLLAVEGEAHPHQDKARQGQEIH